MKAATADTPRPLGRQAVRTVVLNDADGRGLVTDWSRMLRNERISDNTRWTLVDTKAQVTALDGTKQHQPIRLGGKFESSPPSSVAWSRVGHELWRRCSRDREVARMAEPAVPTSRSAKMGSGAPGTRFGERALVTGDGPSSFSCSRGLAAADSA